MNQKIKNQKKPLTVTQRRTVAIQLPTAVQKGLDDDYASSRKAERELDDITEACKDGRCSPTFATARAFQLGVMYANELNERANRKVTLRESAG